MTLVNVRWLLDRDGELNITRPAAHVQPDELAEALRPVGRRPRTDSRQSKLPCAHRSAARRRGGEGLEAIRNGPELASELPRLIERGKGLMGGRGTGSKLLLQVATDLARH